MKQVISCLFFLSLLACHGVDNQETIRTATEMASTDPNRALELLEQVDFPSELKNPDRAAYGVVLAKAHQRKYASLAEDSLILFAAQYYENIHDTLHLYEATKLAADYHTWRKEPVYALDAYAKLIAIAERFG